MSFGIDLGTTNSSVAWADPGGTVYSLRVRQGPKEPDDSVERSLVLDPAGAAVVGHTAVDAAKTAVEQWKKDVRRWKRQGEKQGEKPAEPLLLRSFKSRMDMQRLREYRTDYRYEVGLGYNPAAQAAGLKTIVERVPLYDQYSRDEVIAATAQMLRRLLNASEIDASVGASGGRASALDRLTEATSPGSAATQPGEILHIGVPVAFGPTARRRLLLALLQSGCFGEEPDALRSILQRCRLVYEPLALASTMTFDKPEIAVIFDYGGGTLDIAVLEIGIDRQGIQVNELALGGLPRAGDHLDRLFREAVLASRPDIRRAYDQQVKAGQFDQDQVDDGFTIVKRELSTETVARHPILGVEISREELERSISREIRAAIESLHKALATAGVAQEDVGQLLLTGGSSLVPLLQERLREGFPQLDELSLTAGVPGDVESEREALTGVSRGLARFGFLDRFEAGAASDYRIVVPQATSGITCLERGATDAFELKQSPAVRVPVVNGRPNSFALYSTLVRESFQGALGDLQLPEGTESVDIRVSASRQRFAPAFAVYLKGKRSPFAEFDLEKLAERDPGQLIALLEKDFEWLPASPHLEAGFLTKPLAVGDFIEWHENGDFRSGQVIRIRDIDANVEVNRMVGFDPAPYVVFAAREHAKVVTSAVIKPGNWSVGDVRLA